MTNSPCRGNFELGIRFVEQTCGTFIGLEDEQKQKPSVIEEPTYMSALSVEFIENVSTKPLESILGFRNDELAYPPG